jgi:hypothetical protein
MSCSVYAKLVFGINFGRKNPMNIIKEKMGIDERELYFNLESLLDTDGTAQYTDFPFDVITYYKSSYSHYILALIKPYWISMPGESAVIEPAKLAVPQEKIDYMRNFCKKYGLEWNEPAWHLCTHVED